jgi:hypothetical protein
METGLPGRWFGDDPIDASGHWHLQESSHSAAVAAQEFVLDSLTGSGHSEGELADLAECRGWYTPGQGTAWDDVGNLLEVYGVPVSRSEGSLHDLVHALDAGRRVIVGVESGELPGASAGESLERCRGVPGSGALHAVQVIGVDTTDATHPVVVVNDPGIAGGRGGVLPLPAFLRAWGGGGNVMVCVGRSR